MLEETFQTPWVALAVTVLRFSSSRVSLKQANSKSSLSSEVGAMTSLLVTRCHWAWEHMSETTAQKIREDKGWRGGRVLRTKANPGKPKTEHMSQECWNKLSLSWKQTFSDAHPDGWTDPESGSDAEEGDNVFTLTLLTSAADERMTAAPLFYSSPRSAWLPPLCWWRTASVSSHPPPAELQSDTQLHPHSADTQLHPHRTGVSCRLRML